MSLLNPNEKCLAIVSGGLDSVTMLHQFNDSITDVVHFKYPSNHNEKERESVLYFCNKLNKKLHIIDASDLFFKNKSSLLKGGEFIPEGHYTSEIMKSTVVPFRNTIFIFLATEKAKELNIKNILLAVHAGDHYIYPDCRPEFIYSINILLKNLEYDVNIIAPYLFIDKNEIGKIAKNINYEYQKTYTCYKGGDKHCGKCGACVERNEALS